MNQASSSAKSKTDWARLKSDSNPVKLSTEHPAADIDHIVRGVVRRGLQPLPSKVSISLRVD
jgi:hypothetical protein